MGKVFLAIVAVFLLLGGFASPILGGVKTWRTEDATQNIVVTTGGGITTANVVLAHDLYQANVTQVQSITSTNVTDAPVATSYWDDTTRHLTVAGLHAGITRTLAVHYYGETDSTVMKAIGPFVGVLIIGGLCVACLIPVFNKRR